MFGGIGKIVLVVVVRLLQGRQRLHGGVGLSPKRRLVVPLAMAAIAVVGLRKSVAAEIVSAESTLVAIAVIAVLGGALRACCARLSSVPVAELYPGGVLATDTLAAPVVEVIALVLSAALALHAFLHTGGLHTAASVWMLSAALLEVASYAVLRVRARALTVGSAA